MKLISEPSIIAKSNIILDVKPWDDETDMKELEKAVRQVVMDGLVWGACKFFFKISKITVKLRIYVFTDFKFCQIVSAKLVPLAYGIHKLQISCVVEDEKVSVDELQETLQEIEEYVRTLLKLCRKFSKSFLIIFRNFLKIL